MSKLSLETVIPLRSSTLLIGPPGSGKTELAVNLAREWVRRGEKTLYVTISAPGVDVLNRISPGENNGGADKLLRVIDCYVPQSNATESSMIVNTNGIAHLESISLAISSVVDSLGTPVRIIIDGMSSLFLYNAPQTMSKFVQVLSIKTKLEYGSIMFVIVDGMHESLTMNTMMALVDGVVDIREDEDLAHYVRIRYLKGSKVDPSWYRFMLNEGIADFAELSASGRNGTLSGRKGSRMGKRMQRRD